MEHSLEQTMSLLSRTPPALSALLRDLPDVWTRGTEGEQTWSAFDILGHLVHTERTDWMDRARIVVQQGGKHALDPVDRLAQMKESEGKSLGQLLDEFAQSRAANLAELRGLNLKPEDFEKRGIHPELGEVTLSELLASWACHDMTHLHQISRVLAYQYREAVGPWRKYLGVLHCDGHGS